MVTHPAYTRDKWRIDQHDHTATTVVIADSNGRSWNHFQNTIPDSWVVYSFAGTKLCDCTKLLNDSRDLFVNVQHVLIAVGANDRTEDSRKTLSALRGLKVWGERTGKSVFYVGTPIFPQLVQSQREALGFINDEARDIFQQTFIHLPRPDADQLWTWEGDPIHYTHDTAHIIMEHITQYLN